MKTVSILYGKHYGDLIYVRVFANRNLAEQQKKSLKIMTKTMVCQVGFIS